MDLRCRLALDKSHQELINDLDVKPATDHLLTKLVLTREDAHVILAKESDYDKRRHLLYLLPSRGPKAFDDFRNFLKADQHWLYGTIQENFEGITEDDLAAAKKLQDIYQDSLRELNWMFCEDLDAQQALIFLCESSIFDQFDKERVQNEQSPQNQRSCLLLILLRKRPEGYTVLKKFLWENDGQRHLRETLIKKEAELYKFETQAKEVKAELMQYMVSRLRAEFEEGEENLFLKELQEHVEHILASLPEKPDISTPLLRRVMEKAFPKSKLTDNVVTISGPDAMPSVFTNLQRISRNAAVDYRNTSDTGIAEDPGHSEQLPKHDRSVESWTEDEVCQWLSRTGCDDVDTRKAVHSQQINGRVLFYLTENDLEKVFPKLSFGKRKILMVEKQSLLQNVSPNSTSTLQRCPVLEVLRKFDRPVQDTFRYKQHSVANAFVAGPDTSNLLHPVRRFVLLDLTKTQGMSQFALELAKFTCACLNERANGTLHIGVSNNETDSSHGEIVGTGLSKDRSALAAFIDKMIAKCFLADQKVVVRACVRQPKFIPVQCQTKEGLYVLEIDVVPKSLMCGDEAYYVRLPKTSEGGKANLDKACVCRFVEGLPQPVQGEDLKSFMCHKNKLFALRKHQEGVCEQPPCRVDLRDKLVHLLCQGESSFAGDIYPILVINEPGDHMDKRYLDHCFSFLADVPWKAVFDFDSSAKVFDFLSEDKEQLFRVIPTPNSFDIRSTINLNDREKLTEFQDSLMTSSHLPWMFVNGYDNIGEEALDPYTWKQKMRGFKEAVRYFEQAFPIGRVVIMCCILSKEWEVLLEAAEELFSTFSNQWMCLVEEDSVATPWMDMLLKRNCADKTKLEKRMIVGMPWIHVQDTITEVCGVTRNSECQLPTSTGAFCTLAESVRNDLIDLEILGKNECENTEVYSQKETLDEKCLEEKEAFHKGHEATWWNYWCGRDVCERTLHTKLRRQITKALNGNDHEVEGSPVGRVVLCHQPGAGGTTEAKHVLWDLREEYRCAIVKSVSDTEEVCRQVMALHSYKDEENAKPVLLLLDNQDEENTNLLWAQLKEKARRLTNHQTETKVLCVLLICMRRSNLPEHYSPNFLHLRQALDSREQNWFCEKEQELNRSHKEDRGSDPKSMLSFNIMKENFDPKFIRRTVMSLLQDMEKKDEKTLLKYLAFLNAHDLAFRGIPTPAFDSLMFNASLIQGRNETTMGYGVHDLGQSRSCRWETTLSASFLNFLNKVKPPEKGLIQSLRVTNLLLAEEILHCCMEADGELLSDIALQLLCDKLVVNAESGIIAQKSLSKIINEALRVRRRDIDSGRPETNFSPLIERIKSDESSQQAALVLSTGWKLMKDPFIAQQLARLFLKDGKWEDAKEYAELATEKRPKNSFFWDTYGRVYKGQLAADLLEVKTSGEGFSIDKAQEVIQTALEGIEVFRKVQELSEKEGSYNNAGFFGEIEMISLMLECLSRASVFKERTSLHQFLVDKEFVPPALQCLEDYKGVNLLQPLKRLADDVRRVLKQLDDEHLQLRDEVLDEYKRNHYRQSDNELFDIKRRLESYLGQRSGIPRAIPELAKCRYRKSRIFQLNGTSLSRIFDIQNAADLCELKDLARENVESGHGDPEDYETLLGVCFALAQREPVSGCIPFDKVVQWSHRLYRIRGKRNFISLEPYLFYVMINWPGSDSKDMLSSETLIDVLRQWKEVYHIKYPHQSSEGKRIRKKATTIFFLAKGKEINSIIKYRQLLEKTTKKDIAQQGGAFWKDKNVEQSLWRLRGFLCNEGTEVRVTLGTSQLLRTPITISTSFPIHTKHWWNKKVSFVIGFSWIGPKAFDVRLNDPNLH